MLRRDVAEPMVIADLSVRYILIERTGNGVYQVFGMRARVYLEPSAGQNMTPWR